MAEQRRASPPDGAGAPGIKCKAMHNHSGQKWRLLMMTGGGEPGLPRPGDKPPAPRLWRRKQTLCYISTNGGLCQDPNWEFSKPGFPAPALQGAAGRGRGGFLPFDRDIPHKIPDLPHARNLRYNASIIESNR